MIEKFFNVRDENIFLKNLFKQITTTLVNLSLIIGFVSLSNLPRDLLVSNSKLKKTLEISSMPHSIQEGLRNFGRTI